MSSIRNWPIPKRLTWMNMLVSGAALLLAGVGLFAYDLFSFRVSAARDLGVQAQIIGSNSISALAFDDPQAAAKTLAALQAAPHVSSAEIYRADGRLFANYDRDHEEFLSPPPSIPTGQLQAFRFQNDQVALTRLIVFQGKPLALVCLRSDLKALHDREKTFATIIAAVFLMSLLAALWMSSAFRRSIADPIVRLAETTQIIVKEKDYSARAPGSGEHNEITVLISSFNEMLAQIQKRDAALGEARDRLDQQVEERTAQLTAANTDLEAFSYSVSHDLRAPLRHISAFSQILREEHGATMNPDALNYLNKIQNGVENMGRLIDALLKMAHVSRKPIVCGITDLNSLLKDVLADLQPELQDRRIDWRIGTLSCAECDAGLLKQVFANLVSNAVKYSRRQEAAVIEIGEIQEQGGSVIFVRDNGAGFDEKYANKLFGVFQRLHRAEDFEGTGVGLSTVQRIIKKHGGEIWAKGEVGRGATFFFTLKKKSRSEPALTKAVSVGQLS
jgi:signal transduction histidine kinase